MNELFPPAIVAPSDEGDYKQFNMLVEVALAKHRSLLSHQRSAAFDARECGRALEPIAAALKPVRKWRDFCRKRLPYSERTANNYIQIHLGWESLCDAGYNPSDATVRQILKWLQDEEEPEPTPAVDRSGNAFPLQEPATKAHSECAFEAPEAGDPDEYALGVPADDLPPDDDDFVGEIVTDDSNDDEDESGAGMMVDDSDDGEAAPAVANTAPEPAPVRDADWHQRAQDDFRQEKDGLEARARDREDRAAWKKSLRPGNNSDPDHPYREILDAMTALVKAMNNALANDPSGFLRHNLFLFAKVKSPLQMVIHRNGGDRPDGTVVKPADKFVGLTHLRAVVRDSGRRGKKMTMEQLKELIQNITRAPHDRLYGGDE